MIPQRFEKATQKVYIPLELRLLFEEYAKDQDFLEAEKYLCRQLEGWLKLRPNAQTQLRKLITIRLKKLKLEMEAREMCKAETYMSAMPNKKIDWNDGN